MISSTCCRVALALTLVLPVLSRAQTNVVSIAPPRTATGKRGETMTAKLAIELRDGYHVNSNTPADEYLIPLRLTWSGGPLEVAEVVYPKPRLEKYSFSEKPLSVFSGSFELLTRFRVPQSAQAGTTSLTGKLRYQACSDKLCLAPRTVEVHLPVEIQ